MKIKGIVLYSDIVKIFDKRVTAWGWFFPFIIIEKKYKNPKNKIDLVMVEHILNHERIHLKQIAELFIVFWYLLYFCFFVFNLFKYKQFWVSYRNVIFEKEAYGAQDNLNYLKTRKMYAYWRHKNGG